VTTLLLRLAGPFQAWSSSPRLPIQPTDHEPTFSGVVGLIACAQGRGRSESIDDLARLQMGVRVDRPGTVMVDFQTAFGGHAARPADPVLSWRHYLADAAFLVGLEGPEEILYAIDEALYRPAWPLYLGRRCCLPGVPVWLPGGGLRELSLEQALRSEPWAPRDDEDVPPNPLRLVLPGDAGGERRMDVPLSFAPGHRSCGPRYVRHARTQAAVA
jgi:CRISPR system Cascade subunit CasD